MNREPINDATETILSANPYSESTSEIHEGLRSITVEPLRAIYSVRQPDRVVEIASLRIVKHPH